MDISRYRCSISGPYAVFTSLCEVSTKLVCTTVTWVRKCRKARMLNCLKLQSVAGPFAFYLFANLVICSLAEYSTEDCWALGFNKANLLCSSCDQLKSFDLELIKEHCTQCCQKDENTYEVKRYAQARLEVCTCKFGAYPQIAAFVKSERPSKFPNLQIKYVRGLDPIIKLMDKDGNVKEVLAIDKWNTDSVDEFLKTHLESVEGDKRDYLESNMV